ncbi:hypothetical protein ABW38_08030 [Achromobacter xylosoxidans]|nr:hypothetical protein ABW34_05425 [Achromobacter xylosoxidans]KOQ29728.1 hypothetical protein ABW35_03415 [Achromobacter xylosoxidans]KOQ34554.1 hypothetical protein ABW36_05280 [Achromobacter xylosoxidans]KOQ45519.1 hypothetical protein ABW37_05635 [Achromobacter xylosoxidans]KOQ51376.1 hypothetical protein ABW39_02670 [Achromobacter xylosoxidans]
MTVRATANARALASTQVDTQQGGSGTLGPVVFSGSVAAGTGPFAVDAGLGATFASGPSGNVRTVSFDLARVARTASETRPRNVAYHPRIHV